MLSSSALLVAAALTVGQAGEPTSNFEHLRALDWLTGTWTTSVTPTGEDEPSDHFIRYKWVLNKNAQQVTVSRMKDGKEIILGQEMRVWDAAVKQMRILMVGVEGGHSLGTIDAKDSQLVFTLEGAHPKWQKTSSKMVYTKKDDDNFVVEFKDIIMGGKPQEGLTADIKRVKAPSTSALVEAEDESASNFEHLKALDWLTGKWSVSHQPIDRLIKYEWILNKNVLLLTLTEQESVLAKLMVLWDAVENQMKVFTAISNGRISKGVVAVRDNQLIFENEGVTAKGQDTSSTIIYNKKSEDLFVIESKDSILGGEPQEDWALDATRVK